MPELPEVEIVSKQLHGLLGGREVIGLDVYDTRVIDLNLCSHVPFRIEKVWRRGKYIVVDLQNEGHLLIHLRMTGHFFHNRDGEMPERSQRHRAALFELDNGVKVSHNSIRRFGGIELLSSDELNMKFTKLGPEPLEISAVEMAELFEKYPKANVKQKLLDQSFVVGVGNIYAQEAMYHAGIGPKVRVRDVDSERLVKLCSEVQRILKLSIENNGTTVYNYAHIDGKGDFQHLLAVYGKQECPKGHEISKMKLGGRGTYYCKVCQA